MPYPERRLPIARAMIVAPQPEAVEAGETVLKQGGNALDALLACGLAQGVVDPMMCGIGGLGVLTLYDPRTRETVVIDGLSTCPAACTPEMWQGVFLGECTDGYGYVMKDWVNELGHTAVTTPGALRVYADAHARFGKLAWKTLFDPAIALADEGFLVRPHMYTIFTMDEQRYGRLPWTRKLAHTAEGAALYMRAENSARMAMPKTASSHSMTLLRGRNDVAMMNTTVTRSKAT